MNRVSKTFLLAMGGLTILPTLAQAGDGFVIVPMRPVTPVVAPLPIIPPATAPLALAPAATLLPARERIRSTAAPSILQGFGDGVPLSFAVEQIVPPGHYVIHYDAGVDQQASVSWKGGKPWHAVLDEALAAAGLKARVAGEMLEIAALNPGAAPAPSLAPVLADQEPVRAPAPRRHEALAEALADDASVSPPPRTDRSSRPVVAPDLNTPTIRMPVARQTVSYGPAGGQNGVYFAAAGDTLANVLARWSQNTDWHVVYSSQEVYQLQAGASFEGDFMSSATALIKSINAEPKPLAHFYEGNHVLRIFNADGVN